MDTQIQIPGQQLPPRSAELERAIRAVAEGVERLRRDRLTLQRLVDSLTPHDDVDQIGKIE